MSCPRHSHLFDFSLSPYTIGSRPACSGEAEFNIMVCSLFSHIVASCRRGRGGWPLKCACIIFVPFWGGVTIQKSEGINIENAVYFFHVLDCKPLHNSAEDSHYAAMFTVKALEVKRGQVYFRLKFYTELAHCISCLHSKWMTRIYVNVCAWGD